MLRLGDDVRRVAGGGIYCLRRNAMGYGLYQVCVRSVSGESLLCGKSISQSCDACLQSNTEPRDGPLILLPEAFFGFSVVSPRSRISAYTFLTQHASTWAWSFASTRSGRRQIGWRRENASFHVFVPSLEGLSQEPTAIGGLAIEVGSHV